METLAARARGAVKVPSLSVGGALALQESKGRGSRHHGRLIIIDETLQAVPTEEDYGGVAQVSGSRVERPQATCQVTVSTPEARSCGADSH